MSRFLDALQSGRVLLMDGAMGTELQRAGLRQGECGELWTLTHPERVRAIHQSYVDAGAECLLTNTFQANEAVLARAGQDSQTGNTIQAALQLLRGVAGPDRFVLYDAGPFDENTRRPAAWGTIKLASSGSADAILVETASTLSDLATLLKYRARIGIKTKNMPVLLSWTFRRNSDGSIRTVAGQSAETCARQTARYPVAALGVNCGRDIGIDETIAIIRDYRRVTDLPLLARPNAGMPRRESDRWVYPLSPEEMARRLPELLAEGVTMVGGCCGTTPAHIAALRPVVDAWNARRS